MYGLDKVCQVSVQCQIYRTDKITSLNCRRANSKVKKDDAKVKLLQKDEHLLSLQEKLDQKKRERLELQQKSKSRPPKSSLAQTRNLIRDKVSKLTWYFKMTLTSSTIKSTLQWLPKFAYPNLTITFGAVVQICHITELMQYSPEMNY